MARRVALFVPFSFGRGVERANVTLARALGEQGIEVDFVVGRGEGPYLRELYGKARLVDLGVNRTLASLPGLAHYLRRERPSAMLCAPDSGSIVALWARELTGVKTRVATVTHAVLSQSLKRKSAIYQRVFPHLMRQAYARADVIVAVSKSVADDLAKFARVPRSRIQVIPNPVVHDGLLSQACGEVDHPWLKRRTVPVILSAGRLNEEKNYSDLVRAFARLRRERAARLIILGDGDEREHLERLAAELGVADDVDLPGFVNNPCGYMARANLLALSSKYEALPTTLIEAMACGCPLVAVDCPGGVREILQDGRYGRLVPMGSSELMAQALGDVLNNPPSSEDLKRRALDFHVDRAVARYREVIGLWE